MLATSKFQDMALLIYGAFLFFGGGLLNRLTPEYSVQGTYWRSIKSFLCFWGPPDGLCPRLRSLIKSLWLTLKDLLWGCRACRWQKKDEG